MFLKAECEEVCMRRAALPADKEARIIGP